MGAGQSQSRNGVFIELDQQSFYPGDTVTGKVHVNIQTPAAIRSVILELEGHEQTQWKTVRNDRKHNQHTNQWEDNYVVKYHEGRHEFFRQAIPIGTGSVFAIGQYSIPFSVTLPQNLPGSCELGRNPTREHIPYREEYYWGRCEYKVHAYADLDNGRRCSEI